MIFTKILRTLCVTPHTTTRMWFYGVKREHFDWLEDFIKLDQEVDSVVITFLDFILIVFLE